MHSLSDSTQGYTYTIKWMFGLPEVMKSMHDMDIHEGSTIRVLRKFHDSLIISSANRKIVLGNEVADRIQVQCFIFKCGEIYKTKAERDVTDGKVIEVPPVGGLKARHGDVSLGVALLGNPPADGIQHHDVQPAHGLAIRQQPEENTHAAEQIQKVADA